MNLQAFLSLLCQNPVAPLQFTINNFKPQTKTEQKGEATNSPADLQPTVLLKLPLLQRLNSRARARLELAFGRLEVTLIPHGKLTLHYLALRGHFPNLWFTRPAPLLWL